MRRLVVFVLVAISFCLQGCGSTQALHSLHGAAFVTPAPPPIGDACLEGRWTLKNEVSKSGYNFNNSPVQVSGLSGARVTYSADGTETKTFDGSAPLVGSYGGRQLAIKISGSVQFAIHVSGGSFIESGTQTQLPTTATWAGSPVGYHSYYTPGRGTYVCSSDQLIMDYNTGDQTDTWSRG